MARAGDLIYLARKARGLTQLELARVSGVGQPKISAYERHAVQPTFEIVERLIGYCGMRLAIALEDNSSPALPNGSDVDLAQTLQWALDRCENTFGLLDVRIVRPWRVGHMLLLANFANTAEPDAYPHGRTRAQDLKRFLAQFVDGVALVDLAEVAGHGRQALINASVPLAFVGRSSAPRETRRMPPPPDDRWYATRLLDPSPLHGAPAPRIFTTLYDPMSSYRKAVLEEEKRELGLQRRRAAKEALWRRLDATKSDRLLPYDPVRIP